MTSIIIHGHFYQPPRENPFTGIVPLQASAKPYDNWNESIYRTCYYPNSCSRYLDQYGKILDINNNYSSISSNFGPTLLAWIEQQHPAFLNKLREADRDSLKRTGHSNFIAQCFNHTILPLDSLRNKRIQVRWAIEDYKYRFGHKPEGFWCSECAIDPETVDVLAEAGIKFTILSPWQAVAVDGKDLEGEPAPCDRAFWIKGRTNKIAAFFYDPGYASGISFGHLLQSADKLYDSIVETIEERKNPALLHWATDGEIYGHHEPFGDMALAALIKKINKNNNLEITNYGAFLEKHPPVEEATLSLGDDGLGSSWSCSHGVGRWYRNCGCHTGGDAKWNQKWRGPLRIAFRNLERKANLIFTEQVRQILGDNTNPDRLLEEYGVVACGKKDAKSFLSAYTTDKTDRQTLAVLLDAMKNVLFSFASCGWFFNDLSGIEPRQNMLYAAYAADSLQPFTSENLTQALLSDLREAESNIASEGTGEDIARHTLPKIPGFAMAAGFFTMNRALAKESDYTDTYGIYRLKTMNSGSVSICNTQTLKTYNLLCSAKKDPDGSFFYSVRNKATGYVYSFSGVQVTDIDMKIFTSWVERKLTECLSGSPFEKLTENIENYIILVNTDSSFLNGNIFHENMSLCIKAFKCSLLENGNERKEKRIQHLDRIALFAAKVGTKEEIESIGQIFDIYMDIFSRRLHAGNFTDSDGRSLMRILKIARERDFTPDITEIQNEILPFKTGKKVSKKIKPDTLSELLLQLNFS